MPSPDFSALPELQSCYDYHSQWEMTAQEAQRLKVICKVIYLTQDLKDEPGWFAEFSRVCARHFSPTKKPVWDADYHVRTTAIRALYLVAVCATGGQNTAALSLGRSASVIGNGARNAGRTIGWDGHEIKQLVAYAEATGLRPPKSELCIGDEKPLMPAKSKVKGGRPVKTDIVEKRRAKIRALIVETNGELTKKRAAKALGLSKGGLSSFIARHATDLADLCGWDGAERPKRVCEQTPSTIPNDREEVVMNTIPPSPIRPARITDTTPILPSDQIEALRSNKFQVVHVDGVRRGLQSIMANQLPPGFGNSFKKKETRYGR